MNAIASATGATLDQFFGEPPIRWHPVARYGSLMQRLERRLYADRRANGVAFVAIGAGIGATVGLSLRRIIGPTAAAITATAICAAGKMLDSEAHAISRLLADEDLPAARQRARSLVGRTTDRLDEHEISRAVIESVAENCVDAVTSSLLWATVGGAPAVLAHRSINTLDAMVGHHSDRHQNFGWASARLDDLANWVPARLTALAVGIVRPMRGRDIWRVVRRGARQHPSPNGGIIEAAFAAALDVRLGGVNVYPHSVENRGTLGGGPAPTIADVAGAIRLRQHVTIAFACLLITTEFLVRRSRTRHRTS